jgi:APA family basic amino acid/polyamine antiporter
VPRALLISVVTTSVLYLLVALSVTALVPAEGLASSQSPLETGASTVSPVAGKALAVTALFATASTALICLISISRLLFAMARDGNMPHVLARVLPKRKTPWVAALTLLMLASALVPLGRVEIVASISSFGILLVFIVVQATVIKLRYSKPDLARSFRVPLTLGTLPLPPVLGIAACAALITQFESVVYMVGTGAIALGGVIYLSHRLFVAR